MYGIGIGNNEAPDFLYYGCYCKGAFGSWIGSGNVDYGWRYFNGLYKTGGTDRNDSYM